MTLMASVLFFSSIKICVILCAVVIINRLVINLRFAHVMIIRIFPTLLLLVSFTQFSPFSARSVIILIACIKRSAIVLACNRPFLIRNKAGNMVPVPCGWCMQCRIDKRNEWQLRLQHEISRSDGAFLTLTYNDDNLPLDCSLHPEHVQLWLKRFRASIGRSRASGGKFKYYLVGEYGELGGLYDIYNTGLGRPHYHLIITGLDPLTVDRFTRDTWTYGFYKSLGAEPGSIRYVLKYMDKQVHGDDLKTMYLDKHLVPPFCRMSKGIGLDWIKHNADTIAETGLVIKDGREVPAPRYYRTKCGYQSTPDYNSNKMRKVKEYMEIHNVDYVTALNALGNQNEIDLAAKERLHQ